MSHKISAVLGALALMITSAQSLARDDFGSCYGALQDIKPVTIPVRELFILVDQTFSPNDALRQQVDKLVQEYMRAGDRITLVGFSANTGGQYTNILLSGMLDIPVPESLRYQQSKKSLGRFDACLLRQNALAHQAVRQQLQAALSGLPDTPKTELLGNLGRISSQLVAPSPARQKSVLLVSDMLENSSIDSFYKSGKLRQLDPVATLDNARKHRVLGQWQGTRLYVCGAGGISEHYVDEQKLSALRAFWQQYFGATGGQMAGWGQPALLTDLL
jgi:hypothetical protein